MFKDSRGYKTVLEELVEFDVLGKIKGELENRLSKIFSGDCKGQLYFYDRVETKCCKFFTPVGNILLCVEIRPFDSDKIVFCWGFDRAYISKVVYLKDIDELKETVMKEEFLDELCNILKECMPKKLLKVD